jgi:magnesium-transporting ATPase (P-type)
MSCIVKLSNDKYYMFSKGAPDFLIANCARYIDKNGGIAPIDE